MFKLVSIRIDKGKITIKWFESTPTGGDEEHTLKSEDVPRPALVSALDECKLSVLGLLPIHSSVRDTLMVIGVDVYTHEDEEYYQVSCRETKSHWEFKTPKGSRGLPWVAGDSFVTGLELEAARYVNGQRAQGDLFTADLLTRVGKALEGENKEEPCDEPEPSGISGLREAVCTGASGD